MGDATGYEARLHADALESRHQLIVSHANTDSEIHDVNSAFQQAANSRSLQPSTMRARSAASHA